MPISLSREDARLLGTAHRYFRSFGTLSLDLFSELAGQGFSVPELLEEWEAEAADAYARFLK